MYRVALGEPFFPSCTRNRNWTSERARSVRRVEDFNHGNERRIIELKIVNFFRVAPSGWVAIACLSTGNLSAPINLITRNAVYPKQS